MTSASPSSIHSESPSPRRQRASTFSIGSSPSSTPSLNRRCSTTPLTFAEEDGNHGSNIKVCVRVRPFSKREAEQQQRQCVHMPTPTETLVHDASGKERSFNFDRSYWSFDTSSSDFASQDTIMSELGRELVDNVLGGYNCCLFAYGQTGSGKTYSVLGYDTTSDGRGLLPRLVEEVFATIASSHCKVVPPTPAASTSIESLRPKFQQMDKDGDGLISKNQFMQSMTAGAEGADVYTCGVTYMEIYNEQLRDLLRAPNAADKEKLSVHLSPKVGVYVQGLQYTPVFTASDVKRVLDFGMKARTVGSHCLNDQSSRSHCIFTLEIKKKSQRPDGTVSQQRSKVNLVDLAGSERQTKTQAEGIRLKEGSAINKSLTNLALVINKLAEVSVKLSRAASGRRSVQDFVPFRNSKLTFVLQDSLNGNSKTVMIAALSPAASNYEETISTLRFAESVKTIKTHAKKNVETEGQLVDSLRAELDQLRLEMEKMRSGGEDVGEIKGRQRSLKYLLAKYEVNEETSLQIAKELEQQREHALEQMGLSLCDLAESVGVDTSLPQLVNVSSDPSLHGSLMYFLQKGVDTTIGSSSECTITLKGLGVKTHMATILNTDNMYVSGSVLEGRVLVNGLRSESLDLKDGDRFILGYAFCFRVVIPLAPRIEPAAGEELTLQTMVAEIMPEQSEAYQQCCWYVKSIGNRLGPTWAEIFILNLRDMWNLAEEANAISDEVRPKDRLRFTVESSVDLFHFSEQVPECVVRLTQWEKGMKRWRNFTRREIMKKKKSGLEIINEVRKCENERYVTIAIFTAPAFRARVLHLRQVLDDFYHGHLDVHDFSRPECDPWREIAPWEITDILSHEKQMVQDSCRREHDREKAELEARIMRLEQQLKSKEASEVREKSLAAEKHETSEAVRIAQRLMEKLEHVRSDLKCGLVDQ